MGARDLLANLTGAGFTIEVEGDRLQVWPASRLTDAQRAALRRAKPDLLALLADIATARPYKPTKAEGDAAHAEPWDDADCARFVARVGLFMRRGMNATDADDLAERLHLRDVRGDDRRLCIECAHLAGRAASGRRCGNAPAARMASDLAAELVMQAQRCGGFEVAN